MVRWLARLLVTLSALAATSCAVEVAGTPVPAGSPAGRVLDNPDRITSTDGLGDLPAWDPCSVVNPDLVAGFGPVRFGKPEAFDYCLIEARTRKGGVEVEVGSLFQSSVRDIEGFPATTRTGRLRVVSPTEESGACERLLVFDDGVALSVLTYPVSDHDDPQLCSVSEAVIDQVVASVVQGRSAKMTLPERTIGSIDPCTMITDDMLAKVPGLAKTRRRTSRRSTSAGS